MNKVYKVCTWRAHVYLTQSHRGERGPRAPGIQGDCSWRPRAEPSPVSSRAHQAGGRVGFGLPYPQAVAPASGIVNDSTSSCQPVSHWLSILSGHTPPLIRLSKASLHWRRLPWGCILDPAGHWLYLGSSGYGCVTAWGQAPGHHACFHGQGWGDGHRE